MTRNTCLHFAGFREHGGRERVCVCACACVYLGVLLTLWLFLFPIFVFAAQPKEFFLDGLKKLEQRSHKCVGLGGEYVE
jgi:hypothetical protein